MRRLAGPAALLLLGCVLFLPSACKRKRRAQPVRVAQDGSLSSMIQASDPNADMQFAKGFYPVENGAWRWTARQFSLTLRPPKNAAQSGARLVLKLVVPQAVLDKLHAINLSAAVNGVALPGEEYSKAGDHTYSRDVPAEALQSDAVTVNFTLDKYLPPSPSDGRELGVIVNAAGFELK